MVEDFPMSRNAMRARPNFSGDALTYRWDEVFHAIFLRDITRIKDANGKPKLV